MIPAIIDAATVLHGVYGDPIGHSMSPVMHNAAFSHCGINGVYLAFQIRDISVGIRAMRSLNIKGVSVTIPHKESVISELDEVAPMAQQIGAVNTVINREGSLVGYNSDSLGAVAALNDVTDLEGRTVAVVGAGGAARAVGFGMVQEGGKVIVANRTRGRGERLAVDLEADFCPLSDLSSRKPDILINTTPLGMVPETEGMAVPEDLLEPGMIVMDIVYNPLETRLLRIAKARGCTLVDGASMFVYQGAFQFELWTGKEAPVKIMKDVVLKTLGINHD